MPPVVAVGTGGAVAATRPAHAAQVVVPSAICAPHELQNAIGIPPQDRRESSVGGMRRSLACRRRRGKVPKKSSESNPQMRRASRYSGIFLGKGSQNGY